MWNWCFKKTKWISTCKRGLLTGWFAKQADFIQFDSCKVKYHPVLGFRLFVRCRFVAVWWMTSMRSFRFVVAFHNFVTLRNRLTYQCPSSWPVVVTMKKKLASTWKINKLCIYIYRVLAGPNEWQQVCNRLNPDKTGRNCEGADFSWLSSKVSRTLLSSSVCAKVFGHERSRSRCWSQIHSVTCCHHPSFFFVGFRYIDVRCRSRIPQALSFNCLFLKLNRFMCTYIVCLISVGYHVFGMHLLRGFIESFMFFTQIT